MDDFASSSHAPLQPAAAARALRRLGPFALRTLLGRSATTMAWRADDTRADGAAAARIVVLPRRQPVGSEALDAWIAAARRAARVTHPALAPALEIAHAERWPYVAYDAAPLGHTLAEPPREPDAAGPLDSAKLARTLALALAYAHDAGLGHGDLQPWLVTRADSGAVRLLGLEAGAAAMAPDAGREARQDGAERDVLALGLLLHRLLAGAPAFDEPDLGAAIARLAPLGREPLRLPWDLPRPVPDPLRAIVNRASDRQPNRRFRSARTLAGALDGFIAQADLRGGAVVHAELLERVAQIGVLPALPGAAARAAHLALMERRHTEELAQVVLRDPALSFELLRICNGALVRGSQMPGNGPVLTVRRAIALLGLDGVRRCALVLRDWPGPLDASAAADLERAIAKAQRSARVAQALRPAGYDAEIAGLVALLQNLGRLVAHYHHADETRQMRRLMLPLAGDGAAPEPGLDETAAAQAVFGCGLESMASAVARWWGLDDGVLAMMRRLPLGEPVRKPDTDEAMLRVVASAANEAVDGAPIQALAARYAQAFDLSVRDLATALEDALAAPLETA